MTTITLTAEPSGDPSPFIDVLVDDLYPGAGSLTVWRSANGRSFKVRGLVSVQTASGFVTVRDHEAPFGIESSYRVEYFDPAGEFLGFSEPETVTLDLPEGTPGYVAWMHDPFDPGTAVRVEMRGQDMRHLVRPTLPEIFQVPGRSVGVAIFGGARRGYQQLVLDCVTLTEADAARFDLLFGGYDDDTIPTLCIRTMPAARFPPTLFACIAAPTIVIPDGADMGEHQWWGLTGDEVAPPPEAFVVALLDYADFTAFYADYAEFSAAYSDYTEATRDYTIAGSE